MNNVLYIFNPYYGWLVFSDGPTRRATPQEVEAVEGSLR